MESVEVLEIYKALEYSGIVIWVDGGWGVDALLHKQTRPHDDLDIAINQKDVTKARRLFEERGYRFVKSTNEWNFVLSDNHGNKIDVHAFVTDLAGQIVEGIKYPDGSLTGWGIINDYPVRCIAAEHMVRFHTGYMIRESDIKDVLALCRRYSIEVPTEYKRLTK